MGGKYQVGSATLNSLYSIFLRVPPPNIYMIGYSQNIVKANAEANAKMLGVRLGKLCIKTGLSVIEVANHLKVSRTAVYNWFIGLNEISSKYEQEVKELIEHLKKA